MNKLKQYGKALQIFVVGLLSMLLDISLVYAAAAVLVTVALVALPIAIVIGTAILMNKTFKEIK